MKRKAKTFGQMFYAKNKPPRGYALSQQPDGSFVFRPWKVQYDRKKRLRRERMGW